MRSKTFFLSALLCMVASFMTFGHDAAAECNGGQLPLGDGGDLVVSDHCIVGTAAVYRYGNVNIIADGILEFKEVPDKDIHFWAKSILVEKDGSLIAGLPATPIGSQNGTLTIHLYGSDADKAGIECKSRVDSGVPCGIPVAVWNSNPASDPNNPPTSCVKTPNLPGGVEDCFYRYEMMHGVVGEMGFFGRKVLAVSYGGTLQLFGKKGATYANDVQNWDSRTSWVRLDDHNTKPSQDLLKLDRFVDWEKGDRVVVTSTDYLPGHSEEFEIIEKGKRTSHKGNNLQITRIDPLTNLPPVNCPAPCGAQYVHNGDTYDLSKLPKRLNNDIVLRNGGEDNGTAAAETRAAVALLTRDIRIVSGGNAIPDTDSGRTCRYDCFPIADGFYGGQTMVRQGFKTYQVQGVEFYQLGQGGRIGRYPAHFHLARKTANAFIKDSSIHDSMTRWITIHGTQGVTLARNVGYLSIGHGYYLEDGTETDNNFFSNIGIFARAAIGNDQNPRKVPGILFQNNNSANVPFNSDVANPTVFWIMNGWNDFQYNMAAGANACGVCYWLLPAQISTLSRGMVWESYASIQKLLPGGSPLKNFVGNYCSSAQLSFNTVGATDACNGLGDLGPVNNPLAPGGGPDYYPQVGSLRNPTSCTGACYNDQGQPLGRQCKTNDDCGDGNTCTQNCTQIPPCGTPSPGAPFDTRDFCPVTVLDHYTTSFHWPQTNFAAVWLRGKWMLLSNSVLSDSQNGGLGLVTGGDYTLSSVIPGNWQTSMNSVFIGNTQKGNPLASNAGPFNPKGLTCDNPGNPSFCLSKKEGITMPLSNFAMQQRLLNIYDGPNYQDSNAYLDITKTDLSPQCSPGNCPANSGWMYTSALGIPKDVEKGATKGHCVLPNAAIGWKQPNGFYYPPAFHSNNLYFNNVDIRHLVIEPLWKPGTFQSDLSQIKDNYCTFDPSATSNKTFNGFTAVDRQTVLNDDDGSLTGLLSPIDGAVKGETISVNLDSFFTAPVEAPECDSFDLKLTANGTTTTGGTAKTSPYEYLSTVVYPKCVIDKDCGGHCSIANQACANSVDCPGVSQTCQSGHCSIDNTPCGGPCPDAVQTCQNSTWGKSCSDPSCYGVPLSRQLITTEKGDVVADRTIPMMGMGFSQRSMLTVNNAAYYINTAVSEATQKNSTGGPVPITSVNVFQPTGVVNAPSGYGTYYLFFVYATERTKQKYQMYIGKGITDFESNMSKYVKPVRVDIRTIDLKFQEDNVTWTGLKPRYDSGTGILTLDLNFSEFKPDFDTTHADYCQPKAFCKLAEDQKTCQPSLAATDPLYEEAQLICAGAGPLKTGNRPQIAGKDVDCPLFPPELGKANVPFCIGVRVTLGNDTQFKADDLNHQPRACCFPDEAGQGWSVKFSRASNAIAGTCATTQIPDAQFCSSVVACDN